MDKKQLKRIFNKNIFKDKSFIKMVCFIIVLLLVLVLGSNFGYVSADGDTSGSISDIKLLNWDAYTESDCYSPINTYVSYVDIDESNQTQIDNALVAQQILDYDFTEMDQLGNESGYKYYAIFGNIYGSVYDVFIWSAEDDANSFLYYNGSSSAITIVAGDTSFSSAPNMRYCAVYPYGDGTHLQTLEYPEYWNIGSWNWLSEIGSHFVTISTQSGWPYLLATNAPVYDIHGTPASGSVGGDMIAMWNGQPNNMVNVNYLYENAPAFGGFSDMYGISEGEEEDFLSEWNNNLYANNADWILNNWNGDISHNFNSMSATFTSNLNDYINDSLILDDSTTRSDYTINFDFQAYIEFEYSWVNGNASTLFDGTQLSTNFITLSIDNQNNTHSYLWKANFDVNENESGFTDLWQVHADDFADNYYQKSFNFGTLFQKLESTNSYITQSGNDSQRTLMDCNVYQIMMMMRYGYIGKNNGLVEEDFKLNTFYLTCKADIEYDGNNNNQSSVSGDRYGLSGSYVERFNLLSGEQEVVDDSMLTNWNPSTDITDSTDYSVSDGGSNSNSTTVTTGNVTQTVTVSNEGAKYIPSIISSLIPTSFGDTTTGLASRFTTLVDSNNFITVMANTVPAIPTTVWTYLTEYLGISLYLLACAFVLRLILDLL